MTRSTGSWLAALGLLVLLTLLLGRAGPTDREELEATAREASAPDFDAQVAGNLVSRAVITDDLVEPAGAEKRA